MKLLKKLFDFSLVRWVKNKDALPTANNRYLLVSCRSGDYLFTQSEIAKAKKRAVKNPEDNFENAELID